MWTRAQIKEKAKTALSGNYWRVILVTLIVFIIGGASSSVGVNFNSDDISSTFEEGFNAGLYGDDYWEDDFNYESEFYFDNEEYYNEDDDVMDEAAIGFAFGIVIIVLLAIVLVASIIGIFVSVFIYNPLEIGTKRFFFKNLNQPAEVKEVAFGFDHNYKNVIKILFFRDLYIFGWSLLFVIPGIIKSYEYLMVPYLLAENPNLTKEQAFSLSKQMMMGHKWDTFVLELSFIGWDILSGFTLGILSVFYVTPYKKLTEAALYEQLSLINGRPAFAFQQVNMETPVQMGPYTQPQDDVQTEL